MMKEIEMKEEKKIPAPSNENVKRLQNYGTIGFISRWTLYYLNPLLAIGASRPLMPEDLGDLHNIDESNFNYEKFIVHWKEEMKLPKDQRKITRSLLRMSGKGVWIWAMSLYILATALQFVSPLVLNILVANASEEDVSMKLSLTYQWGLAISLLIAPTISSILLARHVNIMSQLGLRMKTALSVAIFRKSLILSPAGRNETSGGKIVNIMSNDAEQLNRFVQFAASVWVAPIQIIVCLILVFTQVQNSTFVGIGLMVALVPVNGILFGSIAMLRKKILKYTDERVKLMNEIIVGIRVIKFYAWERAFLNRIEEVRNDELKAVKTLAYAVAIGFSMILLSLPIIQPVIIFISYSAWGNIITATKAFTTIALFNLMRFPFAFLPLGFVQYIQSSIALGRIRTFLESEEIDETVIDVEGKDLDTGVACEIKNGTFCWNGPKPTTEEVEAAQTEYDLEKEKYAKKQLRKQRGRNSTSSANTSSSGAVVVDDTTTSTSTSTSSARKSTGDGVPQPPALTWDGPHLTNVNVTFNTGELTAIVGRVGSGKSSMLSAILGELPCLEGTVSRKGSISYAAQQAWILNETVRSNILFGEDMDKELYDRVIQVCALESDMKQLKGGDLTEIGERGINVSGGQKARISLARATYQSAGLYIMDDVLSAVDSHVGKHIFDECIVGEMRDKTRILVTNSTQFLPQCDKIIVMQHGSIYAQGTYDALVEGGIDMGMLVAEDEDENMKNSTPDTTITATTTTTTAVDVEESTSASVTTATTATTSAEGRVSPKKQLPSTNPATSATKREEEEAKTTKGKLTDDEERVTGEVGTIDYRFYFKSGGYFLIFVIFSFFTISRGFEVYSPFWLSRWTEAYLEVDDPNDVNLNYYLGIYALIGVCGIIFVTCRALLLAVFRIKAARELHEKLLYSVIRSPTRFFDITPIGRILNRFSKDIDRIDLELAPSLSQLAGCFFNVAGALVAIAISTNGFFLAPLVPIGFIYYYVQGYFRKSSTEIQRIESLSNSPIFADFSQALAGTATIRAYNKADRFIKNNEESFNKNNVAKLLQSFASQWLSIRLDMIGALISFCVAAFSAYASGVISPGLLGIGLSFSFEMTGFLKHAVRMMAVSEAQMNSVERIREYTSLEQEPEWINESNRPAAGWPSSGRIIAKNMSFAYVQGGQNVLKNINFDIHSTEKIGVVGRTGAGKSSLMVALFRMMELSGGTLTIDDVDISSIGVEDLRKRLGIIPQDPVLFSASLRYNLDPFNEKSDSDIWLALENVQLKSVVESLTNGLSEEVLEGGSNFSVGERQLICIARALLRKPKVLVLDEATASVDNDTDNLIQKMIRLNFKDCTVLTIAHRLHTILDSDRIMVLDEGHIVEFDTPTALFQDASSSSSSSSSAGNGSGSGSKGVFKGMCEAAGIYSV